MVKISIILPVYNAENYLKECLDSLINQTLNDIEIICINDGSTDNSLNILNEYQKRDNRIKIYSQKNSGVSVARNLGLSKISGEFFFFVDSDDWIELNTCEKLYQTAIKRNSDILLFSYYKFVNGITEKEVRLLNLETKILDKNTDFITSAVDIFNIPLQVAGKFYNSKLLKNNSLKFPLNICHGEDRVFFINACTHAKSISVLNEYFYYYRLDVPNSLTKSGKNTISHLFEADKLIKKIIYSEIELKYQDEIYYIFLEKSTEAFLHFWNNCYNHLNRSENFKYMLKIKKEFEKLNKKLGNCSEEYHNLCRTIFTYKTLFIKKLLEPFFEIEFRRNRIAIYIFEKQVLNFSTLKLNNFKLFLRYFLNLLKCRFKIRFKKLRVGFLITEYGKWTSHASLYKLMEKSEYFEPFVILTYFKKQAGDITPQEHIENNIKFFKKHNIKYYIAYEKGLYYKLDKFKPDIIFYQQPWSIAQNQAVLVSSKKSLVCYNPYCFHSLQTSEDYFSGFHGYVWKYFVESDFHKEDYKERFNATNTVVSGSPKLDGYEFLNNEIMNELWNTKDKKRIIYAPHHSFADEFDYNAATFIENGKFILQLAKSHPETEWIFRPHPVFKERILKNNIMSLQEIEDYYKQWEEIGSIYTGGDYYELFATSDCLITDCISFLAEYLPTQKPVLHLRKKQKEQDKKYNKLLNIITEDYYKIYDNKTLQQKFEEVILNENDYLKEKRINNIKLLGIKNEKTSAEKIIKYIKQQLWVKD